MVFSSDNQSLDDDDSAHSTDDTIDGNDAILKVRSYFESDDWLHGTSGSGALALITEV